MELISNYLSNLANGLLEHAVLDRYVVGVIVRREGELVKDDRKPKVGDNVFR